MNLEGIKSALAKLPKWVKANPKKAAVIAVIIVIVAYFAIKRGATATGGAPRRATRYPRGTEWTGRRGFPDMHWSPDAVYLTEAEAWAAIVASLQEDLDEAKRRMVEAGGVAP